MNVNRLIKELTARGVKLRALGGNKLHCSQAPTDLIPKIKQHRNEILAGLKKQQKAYFREILDTMVHGDCLDVLEKLPDNSVDQIVCDPPYGLEFIGKNWDKAVPGVEIWKECLRVLKPGGLAFVMSGPRQDCLEKMIANLRKAGFKMSFTSLYWTYASGFTKAKNIAKAIDKMSGKTGKVVGIKKNRIDFSNSRNGDSGFYDAAWHDKNYTDLEVTEPETEQAKKLAGAYAGFQPKPAVEVILVVMKPLAEKSYTAQAMANGKGCTWLADCRIPYATENIPSRDLVKQKSSSSGQVPASKGENWDGHSEGRFPANLLVSDDVLDDGKNHKGQGGADHRSYLGQDKSYFGYKQLGDKAPIRPTDEGSYSKFFSLDAWAERNLPFLIIPKARKAEKNAGLDSFEKNTLSDGRKTPNDTAFQRGITPRKNTHPCIKPVKLMANLTTMGSRPGDIVLDPFAGSGTTCVAAKLLGRRFIGIEKEGEYHKIAKARVENTSQDMPVLKRAVADIKKHEESREKQTNTKTCQASNKENSRLRVLDLFSGIGGFSLGLEKAGFRTVAFCEIDDFARKILRQHWPDVPIYKDIKELNHEKLKSDGISPDILVGGFPCTDISIAGKRAGIEGRESGLWKEFKRLIAEINPKWVIIENVANLRSTGLVTVLQDLRESGFDAEWHIIPASAVGAPHQRERIWIVAYPGCQHGEKGPEIFSRLQGQLKERDPFSELERSGSPQDRITQDSTGIRGMDDGISEGLDKLRLKALGNAVVPQIPELIGKAILQVCDEVAANPEANEQKPKPCFFSNMPDAYWDEVLKED